MKPLFCKKDTQKPHLWLPFGWICLFVLLLNACQAQAPAPPSIEANPDLPTPVIQDASGNQAATEENLKESAPTAEAPDKNAQTQPTAPSEAKPSNAEKPAVSEDEIRALFQDNPHASTFVVDESGQNNTCARCHAPVNWTPSMDDIPESCLTCKFEIKDPPAYIAEDQWEHIPCKVCHEEGKKGKVNPEIAWLEIAQIGEYAAVASSTEICMKCHAPIDLPEHSLIQLGSVHADYDCTQCHDAHSSQASCSAAGCHDQVLDPALSIPGHDADHTNVDCFACHDGSGLEVGPDPETGIWTVLAYKSHQIELAAPCEKCHFSGNPWELNVVE